MKIFIILIIFICMFSACYESEPIIIGGTTRIFKLQDTIIYYSDTLTLYGENLGTIHDDSNYIMINDTLKIDANNCLIWTQSKIEIIVPNLPIQSTIYVVIRGKKIFYNSSDYYQNIVVLPHPPFNCVFISAESFEMGSEEFGIINEQPIHNVILTKSLYVSECEINQHLYSVVLNTNPSTIKYNDYPVYNVSWFDAIRFCNKLSLLDNLSPVYTIIDEIYVSFDTTANGWRLPTEAEWEYFADIEVTNENELLKYAWFANNSTLNPHNIGLLSANRFGLYDVLGNVWEWCWDWYRADYYSISPIVNPVGPLTGTEHILRGGSCDDGKIMVRKEYRTISKEDTKKIGFRIVRNGE